MPISFNSNTTKTKNNPNFVIPLYQEPCFKAPLLQKRLKRSTKSFKALNFFSEKSYMQFSYKQNTLSYGDSSFINQSPLLLSYSFLLKFTLFLKRIAQKREKTMRYYYFKPLSFLKITKQSKGSRMGKGKGKTILKVQRFSPMQSFIEFRGVRVGRLVMFLNLINVRSPANFALNFSKNAHLFISNSKIGSPSYVFIK